MEAPHLALPLLVPAESDRKAVIKTGLTIGNMTNNISFYTLVKGEKGTKKENAQGSTTLESRVTALTNLYTQKKGVWAKFINILRRILNFLKTFVPFATLSVEAKTSKALVHTNLGTTVVINFTQDKLKESVIQNFEECLNKKLAKELVKAKVALTKINPNATDSVAQQTKVEKAFTDNVQIIADTAIIKLIRRKKIEQWME